MDFDSTFASINDFGGVDYAPHNKGITPVFFIEPVIDERASEQEGRQVYRDMERVRICIAGDSLSAATHPVDAGIIARFHDHYTAWKSKRAGSHIVGTPLSKWPMGTPGLIKECEFLNIYSVEDLGAVSDGNVENLSNGRAIREKARAWLKSATDGAAAMKYAAEASRLREEVAELKKMILSAGMKDMADNERTAVMIEREYTEKEWTPERRKKYEATVASRKEKKKDARKSAWTPERRAAASEAARARGFGKRDTQIPADVEA